MNPLAFIAGAIVGAGALATAAYIDSKVSESRFSPELKRPENLDADETARELNNYFFKAQENYAKCNEVMLESAELISTPISFPWDNPWEKATAFIGGKLEGFSRDQKASRLFDLAKDLQSLYARYRGIFERANAILAERGRPTLTIPPKAFTALAPRPDPSLENDNWDRELDALADNIRGAVESSCELAEALIESLGEGEAMPAVNPRQ